jgi:hypothetical protein
MTEPALAPEQCKRAAALDSRPMLSIKTQTNLRNAQSYFDEHLAVGDYYSEAEKITGEWIGRGADDLGLSGAVGKEAFLKLCENRNPQTGKRLIARLNHTRQADGGREVANVASFSTSPSLHRSQSRSRRCSAMISGLSQRIAKR